MPMGMGCCEDGAISDLYTADDGILRFLLVSLRWVKLAITSGGQISGGESRV